jgi:hypothetical protein
MTADQSNTPATYFLLSVILVPRVNWHFQVFDNIPHGVQVSLVEGGLQAQTSAHRRSATQTRPVQDGASKILP